MEKMVAELRLQYRLGRGLRNLFFGFAISFVAAAILAPGLALAQSSDLKPLLDRLERMERDIRTLNVQISRGTPPSAQSGGSSVGTASVSGAGLARLEVRLSALEEELRAVTGKMESESHQIDQMNKRLDKLVSDIDFRLSALEKNLSKTRGPQTPSSNASNQTNQPGQPVVGAVPPAVPVQSAPPGGFADRKAGTLGTLKKSDLTAKSGAQGPASAPNAPSQQAPAKPQKQAAAALPKGSAKDQYAYAFGLLRQAKYREAENALKSFIANHGKHPLASNARYWLGESYYVRAQYAEAAKIFYKAYQSNKKGNKAPDSLLKLGMALSGLKKQAQACAAFNKLTADYPSLQPSIKKKLAAERQRARCR